MIIVRLQGRLGNQMFQYALARALQEKGKEVKIDSSMLKYDGNKRELDIFQNLAIREAEIGEVKNLGDCNKTAFDKVRRKIVGYKRTHICELEYRYHPEIFELSSCYLEGYWQSEKYFHNIKKLIKKEYCFPQFTETENLELVNQMNHSNSISLHIRRGDYLIPQIAKVHGNICSEEYYRWAISYFKEKYDKVCFFVFTDDVTWAKKQYAKQEEFVIVNNNHGEKSFRDMQLMSQCKHHIIANSSFSWWGAWLGDNEKKEVLTPSRWFNTAETPDIWCDGWVRYEEKGK